MDCNSSVLSGGISANVFAVVWVKGMSLCMSVISPPPPPVRLSFLSVVKPGNLGVLCVGCSLVSWMVAMCMSLCISVCLSSMCLFVIPFMLICRMLSFGIRREAAEVGGGVAGEEGEGEGWESEEKDDGDEEEEEEDKEGEGGDGGVGGGGER